MAKPNRRLTKEQFAELTTIDGNRIETAQDQIVDRFNNLENIDIKRRFTQTQFVFGYTPPANIGPGAVEPPAIMTYVTSCAPWMRGLNYNYYETVAPPQNWQLTDSNTTPSATEITNTFRVKGDRRVRNNNVAASWQNLGTADCYLWRHTWYFGKPVIIDGVSFAMLLDKIYYKNEFEYEAAKPPRATAGDIVDCVMMDITVDNPYVPENKSLTNIVYKKNNFQVDCEYYQDQFNSAVAPLNDMRPAMEIDPAAGADNPLTIAGMWMDDQNLNICVPEKSRVTLNIAIPFHGAINNASTFKSSDFDLFRRWAEWEGQIYSGCLTILEETE